ncbi:MAG TPA: hypothetical protein PK263_01135 [bacterium]|nr:hypothetical protein [bacterium]
MKLVHHKNLDPAWWFKQPLSFQMANIGSEVGRTVSWKKKENIKYAEMAFERALELFDLTVEDRKNCSRLKEILRARELFADWFFDNHYQTANDSWDKYFLPFAYLARQGN